MKRTKVTFRVTRLIDPVKQGGKVRVGGEYKGVLTESVVDRVDFTDTNGTEWVFYPGETCEIISRETKAPADPLQSKINFLKGQLKNLMECGHFSEDEIEELRIPIDTQLKELRDAR
ncbi:MAG: hypothetical protein CMM93_08600 [Rickettsiales bacterium]|nr:hypothetical protein [Rickettsiales bacterium]